MDKTGQIFLFLAAIFSLRLNDFCLTNPFANPENALAVTTSTTPGAGVSTVSITNSIANPGLQVIDFQANRTTFGFADANFTQPFDPALANKKWRWAATQSRCPS
ncbi:MAG: hypothetical protein IPM82_19435 [Saprospiraceae bacterium]|nr:hypothetical protein [Saprospiraceae bacterium]